APRHPRSGGVAYQSKAAMPEVLLLEMTLQPSELKPEKVRTAAQIGTVTFWMLAWLSAAAVPVMAPRARPVARMRPETAVMRFMLCFLFGSRCVGGSGRSD